MIIFGTLRVILTFLSMVWNILWSFWSVLVCHILWHWVGILKALCILRATIHSASLAFKILRFHSSKGSPLYQLRVTTPQEVLVIWYQSNTLSLVFTSISIILIYPSSTKKKKFCTFMFNKSVGSFGSVCSSFLSL